MNLKRIFGALLTLLGIGGLIYAAVLFVNASGGTRDIKSAYYLWRIWFCFLCCRDKPCPHNKGRGIKRAFKSNFIDLRNVKLQQRKATAVT